MPCAKPDPSTQPGYIVADTNPKLTVGYGFVPWGAGSRLVLVGPPQGSLKINWNDAIGVAPKCVTAAVTFSVGTGAGSSTPAGGTTTTTPSNTPTTSTTPASSTPAGPQVIAYVQLVGKNGYYEIADNESGRTLTAFSQAVLDALTQLRQYAPDKPLPASLDSAQIQIIPISPVAPHALPPGGCCPPSLPALPESLMPPVAKGNLANEAGLQAVGLQPPPGAEFPTPRPLAPAPVPEVPNAAPPAGAAPTPQPVPPPAPPGMLLPPPRILPPPSGGCFPVPPPPGLAAVDVKAVKVNGKITVQFQQMAVGGFPAN
jgi:hypothetical protein